MRPKPPPAVTAPESASPPQPRHQQEPSPSIDLFCPVCGAAVEQVKCKVVCPRCRAVVQNCSEF